MTAEQITYLVAHERPDGRVGYYGGQQLLWFDKGMAILYGRDDAERLAQRLRDMPNRTGRILVIPA